MEADYYGLSGLVHAVSALEHDMQEEQASKERVAAQATKREYVFAETIYKVAEAANHGFTMKCYAEGENGGISVMERECRTTDGQPYTFTGDFYGPKLYKATRRRWD